MKRRVLMGVLTATAALTLTGCGYVKNIDSGEVGVVLTNGKVDDSVRSEGFNFSMNPMSSLEIYNVKARQLEMSPAKREDTAEIISDSPVTILTKDNLQVPIDITILYKLKDDCAPHIRKEFGSDIIWDNKVVVPVARDVVRGVVGKDADVYALNQNREKYTESIKTELEHKINGAIRKQCVSVEMVSIKDIRLPQALMDSIMKKNQMQEESLRAELEVKKAIAEANVAVAKAEGTARAQQALTKSITPEMTKWKQLEIDQEAIQKWNGILPSTVAGGTIPFINVSK